MGLRTPLFDSHAQLGAKIVDFGGWEMPLHYGSQLEEHHAVRRTAGVFDVSHMGIIDLAGAGATAFLRRLLANDVLRLRGPGRGLYSCLLREDGGVLDDLIVYQRAADAYRLVVNAGTRDKDLGWITAQAAGFAVRIEERRDLAMLAVQGPQARECAAQLLAPPVRAAALALAPFGFLESTDWCVARTGYTGEDGFELMVPAAAAVDAWNALRALGVVPVGLGARDTLRLEAGLSLYGNDLDETHDPFESGLAWTVALDPVERQFIGRAALEGAPRHGVRQELRGLILTERGVLRSHQRVVTAQGDGVITSGSFAPTLGTSIALARLPPGVTGAVGIDVRGRMLNAVVVTPPFVRHGQARFPELTQRS